MSRPTQETITCPKCGNQQPFVTWSSLNVTLDPQEKQKLLGGELTLFTCSRCGESAPVVYPMLYHDMERKFMAWMFPRRPDADDQQGPEGLPEAMTRELISGGYTFRLVSSLNSLIEKVLIFDHSLDDRVIEIIKVVLEEQMPQDEKPAGSELLFTEVVTEDDGRKAMAFTILSKSGKSGATIPMEPLYEGIAKTFGPRFPVEPPGRWVKVDREYALSLPPAEDGSEAAPSELNTPMARGNGTRGAPPEEAAVPNKPWWRFW